MQSVTFTRMPFLARLAAPARCFHCTLAVFLFTLLSLSAAAQITVDKPIPAETQITVDTRTPGHAVPRTIFGTFLEPIGNSTYNGLWAEILRNPSLEPGLWSADNVQRLLKEEPSLAQASQLGLPLPWEPLDRTEGNRYEPRRDDAANSDQSLTIIGLPGKPVGIKQLVYLPTTRELSYAVSVYARAEAGDVPLVLAIRRRDQPEATLAKAEITVHGDSWTKYEATLTLPKDALERLEPADFVVQIDGPQQVRVDELSLMPADNEGGLDPEMVAMVRDLHTPLIRFGGNFTSGYHWRDGIGPRDKRVSLRNVAWGIPELNTFGTDEFLHFCDLVGARPQIALNLGTGSPQEAADWVKYVDDDPAWKGHGGGQLWELGNELWGDWNTGWPAESQLAPRTLAFSQAVRAVDPQAKLIATGQDPDHFQQWDALQLANPVGTENYLSAHFVVSTGDTKWRGATDDFRTEASLALPVQLGRQFQEMTGQINGTDQRGRVKLAFTEWLWTPGRERGHTPDFLNFAGALVTAGNFNMLLRESDQVPISDMTGVVEFAGIWKKRGQVYGTPASYVFKMYATADADHLLTTTVDGGEYSVHNGVSRLPEIAHVPYLEVVAVAGRDGRTVTLFALNRSLSKAITAQLHVPGARRGQQAEVTEMVSNDLWDANSDERPTALVPTTRRVVAGDRFAYTFPPASVTRLVLEAGR